MYRRHAWHASTSRWLVAAFTLAGTFGCSQETPSTESPFIDYDSEPVAFEIPGFADGPDSPVRAAHRARLNMNLATFVSANGSAHTRDALPSKALLVRLPNMPGEVLLHAQTVSEIVPGVTTLAGTVEDDTESLFSISIENGYVDGQIHFHHTSYFVRGQIGTPDLVVAEIDRARIPLVPEPELEVDVIEERETVAQAVSGDSVNVAGGGNVRVLFLATPAAAARNNVNTMASNIISTFNTSLTISGVPSGNSLISAGVQLIGSDLTSLCKNHIITRMRNRSDEFVNIDAWMSSAAADVAFLIVTTEPTYSSCGATYGRVGGVAGGTFNQSYPFAVSTDTYALGDYTAMHEIGHVLGGSHEPNNIEPIVSGIPVLSYSRGRVSSNGTWMTVMGGYVTCPFVGLPATCVRQPRWSNPSISYLGEATGVAGVSDMAAALAIQMPLVAAWRPDPVPPSAPNPITKTPEWCWGMNEVTWTAQSGATYYQLFRSTSSTFTSPVQIYSGSLTTQLINVSNGSTWYLRAKACNNFGCSAYSSQVSASYFNGCL